MNRRGFLGGLFAAPLFNKLNLFKEPVAAKLTSGTIKKLTPWNPSGFALRYSDRPKWDIILRKETIDNLYACQELSAEKPIYPLDFSEPDFTETFVVSTQDATRILEENV